MSEYLGKYIILYMYYASRRLTLDLYSEGRWGAKSDIYYISGKI